ncbi:expressed unknown protein [Seminavis robusta]|uniref:Uncharacterized protein n=1 Tax=Seminavis robusta TaxID=568900 RepID=A0A9N8HSC2_9STRA|nr:expressed unknown protein [Seminavis robusta]|eukprot:Sro1700_g292110.1 n/a (86) ;mRNA; r:14912-15169
MNLLKALRCAVPRVEDDVPELEIEVLSQASSSSHNDTGKTRKHKKPKEERAMAPQSPHPTEEEIARQVRSRRRRHGRRRGAHQLF